MKSQASVKEKRNKNKKLFSHGENSLINHSLWFIIFTSIIFFLGLKPTSEFTQGLIKRATLENGMVVLVKENYNQPLVALFLCVRTGSANEGKLVNSGITHFVEHMVFKGTKNRKPTDIFKEIESYGGIINAVTSYDYTGYKVTVPKKFATSALKILADMVMNAIFDKQELEKERQVVLREINLSYDHPQRYVSRLLWKTAFSVHPYKYPILGEEKLLNKLTREDLLEFYQTRYVPNNMILAVVGDVNAQKFISVTEKIFEDFHKNPIPDFVNNPEPKQKALRSYEERFTSGITYLLLGFHSVALTDNDLFALDLLGAILGEGESSRLYKLICSKKKLAYTIQAINYTPRQPGLFIISCLLQETQRKRVLSLILKQIALIKKGLVSEKELVRAKNRIISDILFQNQTIEAQAQDLAVNETLTGNFRFTEQYVQKIREVTAQDILIVANKYLVQSNLNTVALLPRDESVKLDDIIPGRISKLKIGIENLKEEAVNKYVLENGLRLLVKENKDSPLVSIKAVFKGGLRAETQENNGLSNLVAQMLDKGTKTRSAGEIAYLVESKGARLSYFSGNNSFGLSVELLSKDLDQMLELLADLIINSTFPSREFKRLKERNLAKLKAQEDNIFEVGQRLLKLTLFEKHPYRFLTIGNEESLKKLSRRDVKNFYQNFCVSKNMVLAVFGDVDPSYVLAKVKKLFTKLNSKETRTITPEQEPLTKTVQSTSQMLPKRQALILMGFPGSTVSSQDRYALEIICQILSQSSGKLFTQIREKTGLAYTLGAYSVIGIDPGYIVIYAATTSENIEIVKNEVIQQLNLLKKLSLSEQELLQAKASLWGKKLMNRQTNSAQALESALDELYGLGYNYYEKYSYLINQVKSADIKRSAQQYFDFNNYAIVVLKPKN
jgi:zinc protease